MWKLLSEIEIYRKCFPRFVIKRIGNAEAKSTTVTIVIGSGNRVQNHNFTKKSK